VKSLLSLHFGSALLIAFAAACAAPVAAPAPPRAPLALEGLSEALEEHAANSDFPGAVALVWHAGAVEFHEAHGVQRLADGRAMRADTIFRIYSMTKAITAVAALTFIEEGRLALDDPLSTYLPEFAAPRVVRFGPEGEIVESVPAAREITIADLFTHTSGLTYGLFDEGPVGALYREAELEAPGQDGRDFTRKLARLPLMHEPGSAWTYGRSSDVLGVVLEVIDDRPLDRILEQRIFTPLGMIDTAFHVPAEKFDRVAALYRRDDAEALDLLPWPVWIEAPRFPSGGGGLFSTASDYLAFCEMLIGGGTRDGVRILSEESVRALPVDRIAGLPRPRMLGKRGWGLGVAVLNDESAGPLNGSAGSFHWSGIAGTSFFVDPERDLIGIFLVQVWADFSFMTEFRKRVYAALES